MEKSDRINQLVHECATKIAEELKDDTSSDRIATAFGVAVHMCVCHDLDSPEDIVGNFAGFIDYQIEGGRWPPVVVKQ